MKTEMRHELGNYFLLCIINHFKVKKIEIQFLNECWANFVFKMKIFNHISVRYDSVLQQLTKWSHDE